MFARHDYYYFPNQVHFVLSPYSIVTNVVETGPVREVEPGTGHVYGSVQAY